MLQFAVSEVESRDGAIAFETVRAVEQGVPKADACVLRRLLKNRQAGRKGKRTTFLCSQRNFVVKGRLINGQAIFSTLSLKMRFCNGMSADELIHSG